MRRALITVIAIIGPLALCAEEVDGSNSHCGGHQLFDQEICARIADVGNNLAVVDQALVAELLVWIQAHSTYEVSSLMRDPPIVTLRPREATIQYEGREIALHKPLLGVYDERANMISLTAPWDGSNVYNVSTLLHELIHFVQAAAKEWDCWGEAEWEAYKLQEAYLIEHGGIPDFNWLSILMSSDCKIRDVHPQFAR